MRWLERGARGRAHPAAAAGRGRGAVRPADDRREAGLAVADRADRDRAAVRHAAAARPDRPGQLGPAALDGFRVVDYKTGRRYAEKSGELQGGRMLQLPLYVLAGCEAARDRPGGRRRPPTSTRPARASSRRSTGRPRSSPPATTTCSRCSTRSSTAARRGDFIIAPSDERRCDYCAVQRRSAPGARGGYAERKADDERLAPARDRDPERPMTAPRCATRPRASGSPATLDANLGVEAGAGTGKTTVLVRAGHQRARHRHGDRRSSWS